MRRHLISPVSAGLDRVALEQQIYTCRLSPLP